MYTITHRVDCKDKRCNVNKSEGGQKQITPLQQHFYGVQCIFQHFAKKEIWDLWWIWYFVCERVLTATMYVMLVLGENWKVRWKLHVVQWFLPEIRCVHTDRGLICKRKLRQVFGKSFCLPWIFLRWPFWRDSAV